MKPISEMTDQELVGEFFERAYGTYVDISSPICYALADGRAVEYPVRVLNWEDYFNEWVNDYMEARGYWLQWRGTWMHGDAPGPAMVATWECASGKRGNRIAQLNTAVKDHRRFRAAVEAALQIIREGE